MVRPAENSSEIIVQKITQVKLLCANCKIVRHISVERHLVPLCKHTKRAAERKLQSAPKKLSDLIVGGSVTVTVPKIDRGLLDAKNVEGKIVDNKNGVYSVETETGIIKNWFPRDDIYPTTSSFTGTRGNSRITTCRTWVPNIYIFVNLRRVGVEQTHALDIKAKSNTFTSAT